MMYMVSFLMSEVWPSGSTNRPEPFCTYIFCFSSVVPVVMLCSTVST